MNMMHHLLWLMNIVFMIELLFSFKAYGSVLKTNSNLKMGVLTGAIRVAQAEYSLS